MQYRVNVNGKEFFVAIERVDGSTPQAVPQAAVPAAAPVSPAAAASASPPVPAVPAAGSAGVQVTSPMPGSIWQILVEVGQQVAALQPLLILEAMKMENEIVAPQAGVVRQILVSKDASVESGDVLIVLD